MKIGIVNDSIMACEVLRGVVLSLPGQDVAWIARNGAEAVAMARANRPDLILMDLFMPGTDGVEATRRIMSDCPCAVLVVTATVSGHISKVYQAMGHGALDAVDTPVVGVGGEVTGAATLLRKIDVIGKLIGKTSLHSGSRSVSTLVPKQSRTPDLHPLVLLGSSTGGPFALAEILAKLPASLKTTIVIVQHVDAAFAPGLCQWLCEQARRKVELVVERMAVTKEKILLAGTDDHLVLGADRRLHYSAEPRSLPYRPSVDVFFRSVARNWPRPGVAVLLTGMGRDGAEGLLELHRLGWKTIAQDEPTSVVWGMPKAAAEIGAADMVLPLPQIAHAIRSLLPDQKETQAQARPASL